MKSLDDIKYQINGLKKMSEYKKAIRLLLVGIILIIIGVVVMIYSIFNTQYFLWSFVLSTILWCIAVGFIASFSVSTQLRIPGLLELQEEYKRRVKMERKDRKK